MQPAQPGRARVPAPSKTFNIAGLDCSFAIIPDPELRKKFDAARRGLVGGVNLFGLLGAQAAYKEGQPWLDALLIYLQANRDLVYDYIQKNLPGIHMVKSEGTYLAWLDCRQAGIPGNPYEFFLQRGRVAMNDGCAFGPGGNGFLRLNFGCPRSMLLEGLERMRRALETIHSS
jgi:cystathionine beta-lyase